MRSIMKPRTIHRACLETKHAHMRNHPILKYHDDRKKQISIKSGKNKAILPTITVEAAVPQFAVKRLTDGHKRYADRL